MDNNRDKTTESTETSIPTDGASAPVPGDEGKEFKIEIRKLDLPVRPRGVLAE